MKFDMVICDLDTEKLDSRCCFRRMLGSTWNSIVCDNICKLLFVQKPKVQI